MPEIIEELSPMVAELAVRIARHIGKVGTMLLEQGFNDAQKGQEAYPADVFPALVIKVFHLDPDEECESVQDVADLWHSDYMSGYKGGDTVT